MMEGAPDLGNTDGSLRARSLTTKIRRIARNLRDKMNKEGDRINSEDSL